MIEVITDSMEKIETEEFLKNLGDKIAKYRKEQHLTQAELAKKVGVQQSSIASYEIGRRQIPITQLFKISEVLYVDVEELLGLKQKGKPGPVPKIRKRLEQIQELSSKKQKMILDFLDSFLQTNLTK